MSHGCRAGAALVLAVAIVACAAPPLFADPRPREVKDGAELQLALERLRVLGSVLYVGAHPDDENTALLSYLVSERKVRAAYLSLTRGDGGQNLIGPETGEQLGVIRTQELLAARRIDGAEQFFSRALDFGYSKSPQETMDIWGRDSILADVVWVIRRFRPDVIITRFGTDGSGGHGHHTASAMLAEEAFTAAADSTRFPEQLRWVRPWRTRRVLWNVFRPASPAAAKSPGMITLDVGAYSPLLGRSYSEIAGQSRSMHKSQGFGAPERRGSIPNFFQHRLGDSAYVDPFEGVDMGWSRIRGGEAVDRLLAQATQMFDPERPQTVVPLLMRARAALDTLGADPWVALKRDEMLEAIRSCAGMWVEAIAQDPSASPGERVRVATTILNRSSAAWKLDGVEVTNGTRITPGKPRALAFNAAATDTFTMTLPADAPDSQPYWLRQPALKGRFQVSDPTRIGAPENPAPFSARFTVSLEGQKLTLETPVVYRWVDPVAGERYRAFDVVPPVTARFDQGVYVFPDTKSREVRVVVHGGNSPVNGTLRLELPPGWRSDPQQAPVALTERDAEVTQRFNVSPASGPSSAVIRAVVDVGGAHYGQSLVRIDHPHIPIQTLLPPAEARAVRTDIRRSGVSVAYVMGSGDQVPDALSQLGYRVTFLEDDDIQNADLSRFDAIVVGVRAYNTRPRLRGLQGRLLEYVNGGGRLVLQYNTADDALNDRLGPYPFRISRDRVTVEEAPVQIDDKHPLMSRPNRITAADFDGWVQERGLYFTTAWDSVRYETPLSCNDPGEKPLQGGLLYAHYGKGVFIYTTYDWFRELPAGVPGAYRLFANLVSANK